MFELLILFGVLTLGVVLLIGLLKLLVVVLLIPFKLAWWAAKGLIGLLFVVPLVILGYLVVAGAFPIFLLLFVLPVILVVAGIGLLVKLMFC
jgi:hypothetical protein